MYRATLKALVMIHGASEEQYAHLRDLGGFHLREYIYVCFNAWNRVFVNRCRPLIELDGCFLKGRYGGQLLSAIGKYGNNKMIPITFVIVEVETKETWGLVH